MQMVSQEANLSLSNKLSKFERKLDRFCSMFEDKENLEPNIVHCKTRSGSGINSKIKHFFQDEDPSISRLDSRKANKSLMSIEERKRLIDKGTFLLTEKSKRD